MKFFEKLDRRGVACNPEQATGLLTGGAGTLFDIRKNIIFDSSFNNQKSN